MPLRASVARCARFAGALACLAGVLGAGAAPAAADCPGATPSCPYIAATQVGQRDAGVLRFPQAIALGRDGAVYVGDQGSHAVQVFAPDGSFQRAIGIAGTRPGELSAVGALDIAGDGSLVVADGANRIDRFTVGGQLQNSWGHGGTGVGEFRFGAGRGNDAGAGGGLAVSGDTVYVADSGNDRVQRFTVDGGHGAQIVAPGQLANPKGVAVRGSRLFVADDQHHRVVVYDTGGHQLRTIGAGAGGGPGQLNYPYDVALDTAGRVFVADDLNQRVVRFSTGPTYPYKARWGSYGTQPGQLAYPRAIATDPAGNAYVANTGNDRVDVFDRGGALLRSFGSSGRAAGQFDAPIGVAADSSGVRAVTDSVNGRVELLAPDGSVAAVWGSPAPGPTVLPRAVAVAFDAAGNALVLDQRRARIVPFSRASGLPGRTIASQGSGPGQLRSPSALAVDAAGTIYVADSGNQRIARFSADGSYLGALTGLDTPRGIAVAPDGSRIYVADNRNHITVLGPAGDELDQFGGTGSKLGKLDAPGQITLDGAGNLWVADRGNNRVQQFGPAGERLVAFGERGTAPGQFVHPTGVSVDCHGTLTVTDSDNNRVQQFALAAPAPSACAALGALGNPPAPKLPTLPVPDGPQVSLRALRTTKLFSARTLPLRAGCDTSCTLTLTVSITQRGKPARRHKAVTVRLEPIKQAVAGGETKLLRPRLSLKDIARLRRALGGRHGLVANVQLMATAAVGAPAVISKRLLLSG